MTAVFDEAWRLHRAGRHAEAEQLYRAVVAAEPGNAEALFRLALLLGQSNRFGEAQHILGAALHRAPNRSDGWLMRAYALRKLQLWTEALECLDHALALDPYFVEALVNRAVVLARLRRYEDAAADYDRLLTIRPDYSYARGSRLSTRLHYCDWHEFAQEVGVIVAGLREGQRVVEPFDAKLLSLSPAEELAAAKVWMADRCPAQAPLWRGERYAHEKIRVAYIAGDFRDHPVARAVAGVLEHHDRARFEIAALSFGADDGSAARKRIAGAADDFIDVSALSDGEIAALIREKEIDIAIDLMGLTADCRPGIFARRPAPIQVNYLGYPGSMGADFMDYLIADAEVVPPDGDSFYSEKLIRLPHNYLPFDDARAIAPQIPSRAEAGLPDCGFVFCCFNASYKILPEMFAIWMRLLGACEGSVLWLNQMNPTATANLRREAEAYGIDPERLIFAPFVPDPADHLARLRLADLFLDTLPYNAHATASDALWAGVPVLTCAGPGFAGRVGASLLRAADLAELIAPDLPAYEAMAFGLARNRSGLDSLKVKLGRNLKSAPLFDTARYTRDLERALTAIHDRHRCGEPPISCAVPSS